MENNNTEILSVLNNINENIKLVVEELKKLNDNKMKNTPNLFDLFGGMNSPDDDDDDDEEEEEEELLLETPLVAPRRHQQDSLPPPLEALTVVKRRTP